MPKNAYEDEVWEAFCAAIAEEDRESILTNMSEAAHHKDYENDVVQILHRTRHNVINVTVEGIVKYKGVEYSFHLEDGDWAGTQLRGWEGTGTEWEEPPPPDPLDIMPRRHVLDKAYMDQSGDKARMLLKLWDIFRTREDVNKALREYAYDSFFQPGVKVADHYEKKFNQWEIEVTRKTHADEVYARLKAHADSSLNSTETSP